jgi:hypothetical protein
MTEARGLTRRFGQMVAVDGLTFSVRPGEVTNSWGATARASPLRDCDIQAPRGALLYRLLNRHRLEEVSVGLMAYW